MKASEMIPSRFIKQTDVGDGIQATIESLTEVNVAPEDQPEEKKWCMRFKELEKPLVLNVTNIKLCEKFFGEDTPAWKGQKVELYVDPSINFGGKIIGGIRLRKGK